MFKILFLIFTLFSLSFASIPGSSQQRIVQPDVKEYRQALTHSDKHKFGYELEESKHFHHTTTEEDGVRLGCYGHVLEGKKYSTQYVADAKGYRTVNTDGLINVFPKSGGERKASFIRNFNEDEIMSRNIRFFFPDGCSKNNDQFESESQLHQTVVTPPSYVQPTTKTTTRRVPYNQGFRTTTESNIDVRASNKCVQSPPECVCTCSYDVQEN